jgi:hypothetical protein
MRIFKYFIALVSLFFLASCFSKDEIKKEIIVPDKIIYLFVTQPNCPSCDRLEKTMKLEEPKKLLNRYFSVKKLYYGEKLPAGLPPPNGTPTVYFLGAEDEILVEPMVGEKNQEDLINFLTDSLYEFKNNYHVDLEKKYREKNETNNNTIN